MTKYRDKFTLSASSEGKGPSPDQIRNASQKLGTPAYKYASEVCRKLMDLSDPTAVHERIYVADPKSQESITRKARDNYGGDRRKIKDGARLTIFTETPEELETLVKAFSPHGLRNNKFHRHMQKRSGYGFHEQPKDYVTAPKRWGYAALYAVMEYGGDTFEVQIYPESMRDTYRKSHELYEEVRASGNLERWEQAHKQTEPKDNEPKLSDYLTRKELATMKEILNLHKEGLEDAGVMHLVEQFPEIGDLPALVQEPDIKPYPQDFIGPPLKKDMKTSLESYGGQTVYDYDA